MQGKNLERKDIRAWSVGQMLVSLRREQCQFRCLAICFPRLLSVPTSALPSEAHTTRGNNQPHLVAFSRDSDGLQASSF
jgi:hypothetical protein